MGRILLFLVHVAILVAAVPGIFAQGTAFTYQGRLLDGAAPADGRYDFRFSAWSAPSGPSQIGSTLPVNGVGVSNGVFTVALDFGAGIFTGPARWLEIAVSTNGAGVFTSLPRQPLTASPYAILAGNVPDGAITGAKLAVGAVTSTNLAPNSVTSTQISTGAVSAIHLATGSVGTVQLAKPYHSGTIPLQNFTTFSLFQSRVVSHTVNFPTPFSVPPVVTLAVETSLSSAAELVQPILVRQKRTDGFDLTFPVPNLPVPVATRGSIDNAPMALVNGWPAIVYRIGAGNLFFARALDANGRRWPTGTAVGPVVQSGLEFAVVNGFPAIAYRESSSIMFVRATETNGATWGAPVTVETAVSGTFRATQIRMAIINGRPAIACHDVDGDEILYFRANDANGDSWPASGVLVTTGNTSISLALINGRPAISCGLTEVRYVRANDANGSTWPATTVPVAPPASGVQYSSTHLMAVATNPAIAFLYSQGVTTTPFSYPRFARATDVNGTNWGFAVVVETGARSVSTLYGTIVNSRPALVWYDDDFQAMRYSDSANSGASFATSFVYRNILNSLPGLLEVAGRPAISFSSPTAGELWYIRDTNLIPDTSINWIAVAP